MATLGGMKCPNTSPPPYLKLLMLSLEVDLENYFPF